MAALPAGVQYGLSSESSYNQYKDLVFVKFTDSAMKAIDDFNENNRGKFGATPTIQFLPGNEGIITIPSGGDVATFHFSLSNNADMEGPQGSFECVRGGGARRLEACGPLTRKMRVQANDDSYEATKHRMARTVAEEQSKCTRVIKPNQTDIGKRVKRTTTTIPPVTQQPPRPEQVIPQRLHTRPAVPASGSRHVPSNPEVKSRPLKERIIQLLALRPFKKPELYSRLHSEGLKERERGLVNNILPKISSLRDNCFHLHRHVWHDVNEDWPFYTEDEKRMLKRRKPQNLTPPLSSDSSQSLSPRASPVAGGGKRADAGDGGGSMAPNKKQRISHYSKPTNRPNTPSSGYATGASSGERHASDTEDDRHVKKDNGYTLNFNITKEFSSSPKQTFRPSPQPAKEFRIVSPRGNKEFRSSPQPQVKEHRSSPRPMKENSFSNITNVGSSPQKQNGLFSNISPSTEQNNISIAEKDITPTDHIETLSNLGETIENEISNEELERRWPPIMSSKMRRQYKAIFAREYSQYREVYASVARVTKVFGHLERRWRRAIQDRDTVEAERVRKEILEEYKAVRSNASYIKDRSRLHNLHCKLQHIKKQVALYDRAQSNGVKCNKEEQHTITGRSTTTAY